MNEILEFKFYNESYREEFSCRVVVAYEKVLTFESLDEKIQSILFLFLYLLISFTHGLSSPDQCLFYFTVPPVITNIKSVLLKQQQSRDKNKMDLILLCETANSDRHPVEFAWMKNGTPLTSKAEMVKVSLQGNNTVPWQYECRVTNLAGTVSRSIVLNPIGKTGLRVCFSFLIK